jgi:putative flavoprotein involved in K+ transport
MPHPGRSSAVDDLDLIVVGGGQAGLAASYWATMAGLRHLVLDASPRTGDTWRKRYDSLRLFTPRSHSGLPGLPLPGDPDGLPTKDELADYLERYAVKYQLPVQHTRVDSVRRVDGQFEVVAAGRTRRANAVILATGPFQEPRLPGWAGQVTVPMQRHSAEYRKPSDVPGARVLVIGGGNSGAQITEELALAGRDVTWSCSTSVRFIPHVLLGRNLFWWLDRLRLLEAPAASLRGRLIRHRGDPVIGTGLRRLIDNCRITVKPASVGPAPSGVTFADGSSAAFDAIVWSTGFVSSYDFLDVEGALDENGNPRHLAGHSAAIKG